MIETLLATVAKHYPDDDLAAVRAAFDSLTAQQTEALETAEIIAELRLDPPAIAAALLVRAVTGGGPTGTALEAVRERFGAEVAGLIEAVQRLSGIRWDRIEEHEAESLRKLFLAMARDVRVVVIVLAMRVQ